MIALKGASEDLRSHFYRTMSSRAVEMMKEDSEVMGPVRSKDVAEGAGGDCCDRAQARSRRQDRSEEPGRRRICPLTPRSLFDVVASLQYRDIAGRPGGEGIHPLEMDDRLNHNGATVCRERSRAPKRSWQRGSRKSGPRLQAQAEQKLRQEMEQKLAGGAGDGCEAACRNLQSSANDYFTKVEAEIVQLALSIAAKILHREAQVDPMLVATLVRMAIERMREQSGVTVRVATGRAATWKQLFCGQAEPGPCADPRRRAAHHERLHAGDRTGFSKLRPGSAAERG